MAVSSVSSSKGWIIEARRRLTSMRQVRISTAAWNGLVRGMKVSRRCERDGRLSATHP